MPVRVQIPYKCGTFFITFTCARWIPLFQQTGSYDVVYKWFDYLKSRGHFINAFVIMPDHVHAIISFSHGEKSINRIIGDGKRWMSYDLVRRLRDNHDTGLLALLQKFVNSTDAARNKHHEVFEPSFDWKLLESDWFIEQKLNYIHQNPCMTNPPLVENAADYRHSSAAYYLDPHEKLYPVKLISEMKDVNLTLNRNGIEL